MNPGAITDALIRDLAGLKFGDPVTQVYNPLIYARKSYDAYWHRYGSPPREILLLGMNPGPWGMAQTGVPFGDVEMVRDWLGIEEPVAAPAVVHPKRPVEGFGCRKREGSGKRFWGWARDTFGRPEQFFARFFVANYCPLLFLEASGRNRTPNFLPVRERRALLTACDRALLRKVEWLQPRYVIGVGRFAEQRIREVLGHRELLLGCITHPSPANPRANKNWAERIRRELGELGITY